MAFIPVLAEIADKMPPVTTYPAYGLLIGVSAGFPLGFAFGRWALLFVPLPAYLILCAVGDFYQDAYFREAVFAELGTAYAAWAVAASCLPLIGLLAGIGFRYSRLGQRLARFLIPPVDTSGPGCRTRPQGSG